MQNVPVSAYRNSAKMFARLTACFLLVPSWSFGDLVILSSRHDLGSEESDNTILVDFEITATTGVLLRHVGPHLGVFGVSNALSDPALELYDASDALIGSNDNWGDATNATELADATAAVGGFALENGSQDSAMLMTLDPGKYRVKFFSDTGATGTCLSEAYVTDPGSASFKTVSVEAFSVSTTFGRLIPGFINVNSPSAVLIRALGVGTGASANPSIEVYSSPFNDVIASNEDWEDGSNAAQINPLSTAVGLTPLLVSGSTDSAVLLDSLDPGGYTVLNSSIGRVRIEIADVTDEFESSLDPLIGGTPLPGVEDWFGSDWFGYYGTAFAPWILHIEHGPIFRHPDSTNESMFVYDDAMGAWWWTNETLYPFIYAYDPPTDNAGTDIGSEWLFYFEGSSGPRSFGVVTGPSAGSVLFFGP